jgi:hypothetical protein
MAMLLEHGSTLLSSIAHQYSNVRRVFGAVRFTIMISRSPVDFRRASVAV